MCFVILQKVIVEIGGRHDRRPLYRIATVGIGKNDGIVESIGVRGVFFNRIDAHESGKNGVVRASAVIVEIGFVVKLLAGEVIVLGVQCGV